MLLQSVLDASDAPIFSVDLEFRYTSYNRSLAAFLRRYFGVEPALGLSLPASLPQPADRHVIEACLARASRGEHFTQRIEVSDAEGSQRWLELAFHPIQATASQTTASQVTASQATASQATAGHASASQVTGIAVYAQDVTAQRGHAAELAQAIEQNQDLEAVINHSKSVVMRWRVAPDFPIDYVTRNVDQFGFDPADLMGPDCAVSWTDRLHPDDGADFEERLTQLLAADLDEYVLEYRVLDRAGHVRWVTDRTHAFRDQAGRITSYVSIIVDITERMQRELELQLLATTAAALSQAPSRTAILAVVLHAVEQAFETPTAVLCTTTADAIGAAPALTVDLGRGEWASATGARLAGDQGIFGLVLASRQPMVLDHNPAGRNGRLGLPLAPLPAVACVPLLVGDAAKGVLVAGRSHPFNPAGVRLLATLADMAANALDRLGVLETLEQRVAERTQDLLKANQELERLAQHKDEFLATMNHELRTPLTAVLGLSEAIDTGVYGPLNDRQQRAVQIILQSGRHLLHLINDLLDLSRIEVGRLELQLEPCHIEMVCQSSVSLVGELAKAKQQSIHLAVQPPSLKLYADTRRLHQLLLNLLSNATKFTPDGGLIDVTVQGDVEARVVRIEVADTGIGIPEADRQRIFEPFVQLDSRLARQYAGSGLGLALVKSIAAIHGGTVEVFSVPEQGSRFVVTLPWRTEPPPAST